MKPGEFNNTVIKRLFQRYFKGKNPLELTAEQKTALAEQLKSRLTNLGYVKLKLDQYPYRYRPAKPDLLCEFKIEKTDDYQRFEIVLDGQNKLTINHYSTVAYISDVEEIFKFIAACQEIMGASVATTIKRQKIYDLQVHAITAQVKKIITEEKIDFLIEKDSIQFKLYLKISEKEYLEFKIPVKRFKEIVPHLQTVVQSLLVWHKMGLKIKDLIVMPSGRRSDNRKWIKYSSL